MPVPRRAATRSRRRPPALLAALAVTGVSALIGTALISTSATSATSELLRNCDAKPTAANTGATGALPAESDRTITRSDSTVSNVHVDGALTVVGDGVVVRNVSVDGPIIVFGDSVTVDRVTARRVVGAGSRDLVVSRSNLSGGGSAVHLTSDQGPHRYIRNVKLVGNYIHDPAEAGRESYSGTHIRGAAGVTISCSNYELGAYGNAAVFVEDANGGTTDVQVSHNWINGGGYTIFNGGREAVLRGNVFGRDVSYGLCWSGSPVKQIRNALTDGTRVTPCGGEETPEPSTTVAPAPEVEPSPTDTPSTEPTPTSPGATMSARPRPTAPPSAKPSPSATTSAPTPTAKPTPTSTPTSAPPVKAATGGCTKPSAGNTGATGSRTAKSTTVLNNGQTLENADVSSLEIRGSDVTVRNVKVNGVILVVGSDVLIDRVTAQGIGISSASNVTVQHSEFAYSQGSDGIHVTSDRGKMVRNVVLRHNYVHDPRVSNGSHFDATQVRGVDGLVIECSNYDPGPFREWMNAAVYLENANGGNSNIRVSNNWLYGHAFPMMVGAVRNVSIENNRIGGDIKWDACNKQSGLNSSEVTSSGNVWDASGKSIGLCK